ncbi:hypothetical protein TNCV_4580211 [Trichonephila clavipes]|nr:hypothetical protein TNCV_4580211 [Trichonephila clavipes]
MTSFGNCTQFPLPCGGGKGLGEIDEAGFRQKRLREVAASRSLEPHSSDDYDILASTPSPNYLIPAIGGILA